MEVQNWTKQEKQRDRSPSFVDVLSHGFLLEEVTLTSLAGAPAGLQPMLQLILSGQQCGWVRTPAVGCNCVPIVSSKKVMGVERKYRWNDPMFAISCTIRR